MFVCMYVCIQRFANEGLKETAAKQVYLCMYVCVCMCACIHVCVTVCVCVYA
jgi:hypothetical protein